MYAVFGAFHRGGMGVIGSSASVRAYKNSAGLFFAHAGFTYSPLSSVSKTCLYSSM